MVYDFRGADFPFNHNRHRHYDVLSKAKSPLHILFSNLPISSLYTAIFIQKNHTSKLIKL